MIVHRALRAGIPLALSLIAAILLLMTVDLGQFHGLAARVRWEFLPEIFFVMAALELLFAFRWYLLLRKTCAIRAALIATALGLAGNQVLPARGGDIVRAVYSARWNSGSVHLALSALLVEKMIDLLAVGAIGLFSILFLIGARRDDLTRTTSLAISAGFVALLVISISLLRAASGAGNRCESRFTLSRTSLARSIALIVANIMAKQPRRPSHLTTDGFHALS